MENTDNNLISIIIDNKEYSVPQGSTLLNACKDLGIEIPSLCHHPAVKTYGACGVCLVEVEGSPKPLRACALQVREGMVVRTRSEAADRGRCLALELLFSDHRGDCMAPCMKACPAHTDCQAYTALIKDGDYQTAYDVIREKIPLPAGIGRVCPHPCESACRRQMVEEPVNIAALKRFAGEEFLKNIKPRKPVELNGKAVAVIGGGPAGLTAASLLRARGYRTEIFEAMPECGGMLRYGIPAYRLPKDVLAAEIDVLVKEGIIIHCNTRIGKDIAFAELKSNFDAVYVAIGAAQSYELGCDGDKADGVLGGIDFLGRVALGETPAIGDDVIVVGGGNTAMDACRTAIRLGAANVTVVYRRTEKEMPAEAGEIAQAKEEGVKFAFLSAPLSVETKDGKVTALKLQRMELGEEDASGRRRPVPVPGAIDVIKADTVIAAIGQKVDTEGIPCAKSQKGTIQADCHTYLTDIPGVFAGGDCINKGPGIAVEAIACGCEAADMIDAYLKGDSLPKVSSFEGASRQPVAEDYKDVAREARLNAEMRPALERCADFNPIDEGFDANRAKKEASRCLECGCGAYYDCKLIKYGREYDIDPVPFMKENSPTRQGSVFADITYDRDKCVLCGLCVRYCTEVKHQGVLNLLNRGFDTLINPVPVEGQVDFCLDCHECADICPTGALISGDKIRRI